MKKKKILFLWRRLACQFRGFQPRLSVFSAPLLATFYVVANDPGYSNLL
jgi:hypothetical protein